MRLKIICFVIVVSFCICLQVGAQDNSKPNDLKDIRIEQSRIHDALARVAHQFQTVVGFENIDTPPPTKLLTIQLDGASLTQTMDAIVKADGRYSWRQETNGAVHVFNSTGELSLGSIVMPTFFANRLQRHEVVSLLENSPEVRGWTQQHGCSLAEQIIGSAAPASQEHNETVTISTNGKTLRENLDEASEKLGTRFWTIQEFAKQTGCEVSIQLPPRFPQKQKPSQP